MCGIAGFCTFEPPPDSPALLRRMLASLRHRGPDDEGRFVSRGRRIPKVALGNRRLAVIDLEGGKQPVFSESKDVVAVFNGEIYNYRELRSLLESKGHRLSSSSDTEVIPHLYEEYGVAFLEHLRGMFAIALYDGKRLLLARDRFGIKPLYYAELGERGICFASEPGALSPLADLAPEPALLPTYLSLGYFPAPLSPYKGVKKLPAGHLLEYDGREVRTRRWWEPESYFDWRPVAVSEVAEALKDSVEAHLVADVPIGVLLSGGIDSSVVAAMAARHGRDDLVAFTASFRPPGGGPPYGFDETEHASRVASALRLTHRRVPAHLPSHEELFAIAARYGEPIGDEAAIPTYAVARAAREHVKVVLTGEGGDEVFGGYDKYRSFFALRPLMAAPAALQKAAVGLVRLASGPRRADKVARILEADLPAAARAFDEVVGKDVRARLLSPDILQWPVVPPLLWESVLERSRRGDLDPQWVRSVGEGLAERFLLSPEELAALAALDICGYLADGLLHKVDSTTMAHGLEARVPYLDHIFFEQVGGVALLAGPPASPASVAGRLLSTRTSKPILRSIARQLLPPEVAARQKQGFSVPLAEWVVGFASSEEGRYLLDPKRLERQECWNVEGVAALVDGLVSRFGTGKLPSGNLSRTVWLVLAYQLWLETVP